LRGFGGQRGRVFGEAGVERVGRQIENFGNRFQRQVAGKNGGGEISRRRVRLVKFYFTPTR
jgi:hypothetical protein